MVSVFGGGNWGRALAFAFSENNKVNICSRRELPYINDNITQVDPKEAKKADYIVVAIATNALREWLSKVELDRNSKVLVASKGIEEGSGCFVSDIFASFLPQENLAFLGGPSFATEVLNSLPTAITIHSSNLDLSSKFGNLMPSFIRAYTSYDVVGGEVAGAYKNVIAIAGGICDGLGLGSNAKASLIARGLVEMCRFGEYFGAKAETFLGLSGAGDLFLTSSSTLSRNYRVGISLSRGKSINSILEDLGEVAEGVRTARAIVDISRKEGIYTPIAREVLGIIDGKDVGQSIKDLMR